MKRKVIGLFLAAALVFMLAGCGLVNLRPDVKTGEFNFSITYELNGEEKTFSAVYVCEYDGASWSIEGGDFSRDWADHVVGDYVGDDYSAVIGTTEDGGDIILFFGIYPQYFMGDSTGDRGVPEASIYVAYVENEGSEIGLVSDPAEVEELYGAKVISCEYDAPIKNSFGMFK